jgi:hypothetical protein
MSQLNQTINGLIETRKGEDYENMNDLLSRFMCLKDDNGKPYDDKW